MLTDAFREPRDLGVRHGNEILPGNFRLVDDKIMVLDFDKSTLHVSPTNESLASKQVRAVYISSTTASNHIIARDEKPSACSPDLLASRGHTPVAQERFARNNII